MKRPIVIILFITAVCLAGFDARREILKFMEGQEGLEKYLHAPVTISQTDTGSLLIRDEGIYAFQYELLRPAASVDPNIVLEKNITIPPTADKLVLVTHGWLDKARKSWPNEMAAAIGERVDPNEWVCASYGWQGGSVVVSSIQAVEYARDVAGPRLAKAILSLGVDFKHIHFIGHSAGTWVVNTAARQIAEANPDTRFHLTLLDAYVPSDWDQDLLGRIYESPQKQYSHVWAEHYYTKDITFVVTEYNFKHAHNVNISALDPLFSEHEFPYRWYFATITGAYTRWDEKREKVITRAGGIDYGFARSLESGKDNWARSRKLDPNNTAVILEKPK